MLNPVTNNELQIIIDAMVASGYLSVERANDQATRDSIVMNLSMMKWFVENGLELGDTYEQVYSCALIGGGAPPTLVTTDLSEAMAYIEANPTYYLTIRWKKKIT